MNTNTTLSKGSRIHLNHRPVPRTSRLLLLLLLALPAAVQAQFTYVITNGTITITGYTGSNSVVSIPSSINGYPVTSIGDNAFSGRSRLTTVMIPNSVTNIGGYTFCWCTSLTDVTIPSSVISIGGFAFAECFRLTDIGIPMGVASIGDHAFDMSGLTSITIPGSVTSFGGEVFENCTRLGNATIESGVASIGISAFYSCTSLTTVTIPDSVTNIGDWAFASCTSLTHVTIPNSVASIGVQAFAGSSLTSITIPSSISSVGEGAFRGCSSMTAITVEPRNPFYSSVSGVLFDKNQTTLVQYPGGVGGNCTIPSTVTQIGTYAFAGCCELTNVTIPNSVASIGAYAFLDCYELTNVTIPNSVASIGEDTFELCTHLTSITIPNSVTSIGFAAFSGCTCLTSITIPNGVTYIGDNAFSFSGLKSITIPNRVTYIGGDAFSYCLSLTSVTIPGSVTNIGTDAFFYCTNLTNVTIGNGVTSIGDSAFEDCTSLTNVSIPNSITSLGYRMCQNCIGLSSVMIPSGVTNIGEYAFNFCTNLTGVFFLGNAPELGGADVFYAVYQATVYYLPGTTGWGATFGGLPTAPWIQVPTVQMSPLTQTAEAGSGVRLGVQASSPLPLFYFWYLNTTNLLSSGTDWQLELTHVQLSQSGAYTVVISNVLGAVTSAPVMLNVIAPVERRPVPGVEVMGETASLVNVDYAGSLSPAPNWTLLGSVSLTSTPQYCFDLTLPLPPQRFYRAWQTGTPGVRPSLDLHQVPAIALTGSIGHSVRLDYINQFGPTDAWVTLATVPLTNTSQLYFDISSPSQPPRLYRLVQVP